MKEASGILGPLFHYRSLLVRLLGPPGKSFIIQPSTRSTTWAIFCVRHLQGMSSRWYVRITCISKESLVSLADSYSNKIKRNTATVARTHVGFLAKYKSRWQHIMKKNSNKDYAIGSTSRLPLGTLVINTYLISFISIHCCIIDGACIDRFCQDILISHPLRSQQLKPLCLSLQLLC